MRARELYTIINGKDVVPIDVGLRGGAGTFLETMDITEQVPLFANPFGNYSSASLEVLLKSIEARRNAKGQNRLNLEKAIQSIEDVQTFIEDNAEQGLASPFIRDYSLLKGYDISEVREQVSALGYFVSDLEENRDATLRDMLNFQGSADEFFGKSDVLQRFGIVASGNLGLFEIATLVYSGILAQAAKNGHQFSLIVKPSSEDSLFYDLIVQVPEDFRAAFNRVTWRSDVAWDQPLMKRLVNSLDGAAYFGQKNTLDAFRGELNAPHNPNHHFYYDHFPLMVIGSESNPEQLEEAAKIAVALSYKGKGESCLSLQDVFVHEQVYEQFLKYTRQEIHAVNNLKTGTPLPRFSKEFLNELDKLSANLRKSGATVSGRIGYEPNKMDIIFAYDINPDNSVLSTENAAPFLSIAHYSGDNKLATSLFNHLKPNDPNRTADEHIYSIVIGIKENSEIFNYLQRHSHRLVSIGGSEGIAKIKNFRPYETGIPHCGGISFLADMFGIPHLNVCYK